MWNKTLCLILPFCCDSCRVRPKTSPSRSHMATLRDAEIIFAPPPGLAAPAIRHGSILGYHSGR